jgi:tetratricopeptide (TPR) repeat protein
MTRPFLSAALIVRNEEQHLRDCLDSIRELVDEVVIVDTGSTDGTVPMAERLGATVHHYAWHDDFAAARNHCLERCTGTWILYIDADERARPLRREELTVVLSSPDLVACNVVFHARTGHTPYRELRLFRNDRRIRFRGIIHESIWPGVGRYVQEEGGTIGQAPLVLDHVGYDGPQHHKHERNLTLLQKALAADPNHVYCWYHLGMVRMEQGLRAEAREAWASGIRALRRTGVGRPADALPFLELIRDRLEQNEDVSDLLAEARSYFPDDMMLRWLGAQALVRAERFEDAARAFTDIAEDFAGGRVSLDFGYDERQFTSMAHGAIGSCWLQLARYEEAAGAFARAAALDPDDLEFRTKRDLCRHLAAPPAR